MKWVPDFVPQIPLKKTLSFWNTPRAWLGAHGPFESGTASKTWDVKFAVPRIYPPGNQHVFAPENDGWKISSLLGRPIFRGYVSFREGKIVRNGSIPSFQLWNFREDSPITSWWLNHPIEKNICASQIGSSPHGVNSFQQKHLKPSPSLLLMEKVPDDIKLSFWQPQCNTLPPLSSWICFNCFGTSKIYSPNDGFSFMVMNPTGSKESVKNHKNKSKTNPSPLKKSSSPKEFLTLRG